ncbi:type III-B CRISPR module RAMP protein Cmr4 [Desulfosarcina sp. OttesenSCG-928-A07]|nr:type III-B CRISPR module RAMP protein Cmr4 [Desulfosarcina sp. OttesenSCG-928-G17]MDL2330008.1 type III-B CRISPR module RAMP protein Cmr4 [Desulfosarcina sp. OttesenSCG-928-A07]
MNQDKIAEKAAPCLLTMQAITFLHPGTGQTTGVVDLPIQREVHTGFPMIAGSSLKGSLRDKAEHSFEKDKDRVSMVFGSQVNAETDLTAGSFSITDARILAFPVRSLQHVFVWVTCPMVLKRMKRDAGIIGLDMNGLGEFEFSANKALVRKNKFNDSLFLEEIQFELELSDDHKKISNFIRSRLCENANFDPERLVIIPDEDFEYLVTHATQVSTRIKLDENKTTSGDGGNMWVEETLPPETLLYSLVLYHEPRMQDYTQAQVIEFFQELMADGYLQIGANETVGQGWCCVRLFDGKEDADANANK